MLIQWSQASALGGWTGLLSVGERSTARPLIEAELSNLVLVDDEGHDGQLFYLIARDPLGDIVPDHISYPGYRYRRILYPLLAGGLGILKGQALLWSMVGWSAASIGAATMAARAIGLRLGLSSWVTAGVLANPGVWLSAQILTSDAMALALLLLALWTFLAKGSTPAVLLLVLGTLAKETSILIAVGMAGYLITLRQLRKGVVVGTTPALALAAWLWVVESRIGGISETGGNLGWPLMGLVQSSSMWSHTPGRDQFLIAVSLAALLLSAILPILRPSLWKWLIWPWLGLALGLSHFVWDFGNNAARAMAPLIALVTIAALHTRRVSQPLVLPSSSRRNLPV
jgi:hypothetical protein